MRPQLLVIAMLVVGCDRVFGIDPVTMHDAADAADAPVGMQDPAFVRIDHTNYSDGVPRSSVTATIGQVDQGDLMVVAVCASRGAMIDSVVDANGTTYTGTAYGGTTTLQADLYSAMITASRTNFSVKVVFTGPVVNPDIRLAEYTNVAPSPPLATMTAVQTGTSASVGPIIVTATPSLVVLVDCVGNYTTAIGTDYLERVQTSPNGDIVADKTVTIPGSVETMVMTTEGAIILNLATFAGTTAR